jgi:hypothetical protein
MFDKMVEWDAHETFFIFVCAHRDHVGGCMRARVVAYALYDSVFQGHLDKPICKKSSCRKQAFFAYVYACDGLYRGALNTYKRSVKPPFACIQREIRCLYVFNKGFVFPIDRFTLEVRVR